MVNGPYFLPRGSFNKTLIGKFHGQKDMFQQGEHRNSRGSTSPLSRGLYFSPAPGSSVWEEEEACVFSLTVCSLPLAHVNSYAFACENYLPRLPN